MVIKKDILMHHLKLEGMTALDLCNVWNDKYNFNISYKNFNKLINNKVVWKMSYAVALLELFHLEIKDLFEWKK